jgi:hypothetical protein
MAVLVLLVLLVMVMMTIMMIMVMSCVLSSIQYVLLPPVIV